MSFSSKIEKKLNKKLKRHQHVITKATSVTCADTPTKYLGICNAGQVNGLTEEIIYENFHIYGILDEILLIPGKSCCFLSFKDTYCAQQAFEATNAKLNIGQDNKPIYLTYVKFLPEIKCQKVFDRLPPGLEVVENFITELEESTLLSLCKFADSNGSMKHRQVKHFGYEFRYDVNNVYKDKPLSEKIPKECSFLWRRLNFDFMPDQLTVNHYEPGQGIPAHIDTHSTFEDPILSLSLSSSVVMEFKRGDEVICVLLPRRSLAVIEGEARYDWTHAIIPRTFDFYYTDEGCKSFKRATRVSFTFRKIRNGECQCNYKLKCDSQTKTLIENSLSSKLEKEYVQEVYENIAGHFSETRHKPWPKVLDFVKKMPTGAVLLDVGCGNGKYFGENAKTVEVGLDSSLKLTEVCSNRGFQVVSANCTTLPIKDNSIDGIISIAVIHHLSTDKRRLLALNEIVRVLRVDGEALIYVWSKQQIKNDEKSTYIKQDRKNWKGLAISQDQNTLTITDGINLPVHTNRTNFNHSDVLVPWKLKNVQDEVQTFLRFYHVFEEGELEALCLKIPGIIIQESYYDQGNYCVRFEKVQ